MGNLLCSRKNPPVQNKNEYFGPCNHFNDNQPNNNWICGIDGIDKGIDNDIDDDNDDDSYYYRDSAKSNETLLGIGALLKYEQIYCRFMYSEIIGSYSYQCCAVSAVAYINAIMLSGLKSFLPLPSFLECCTIAFCGGGDIMKSILMLECHYNYGIICEKVDIHEMLFSCSKSESLVACFSSLDSLLNGALEKDSLKYLGDSNNHLSCVIEKYDFNSHNIICRKPWCPSESFQFAHMSVRHCSIIKVHSMFSL